MKRITALIAAAILALTISTSVFAEQESENSSDTSLSSAAESPESSTDMESETDTENDITADENETDVSENSDEKPKKVYYTDYAIPEAEMYISFPNDMYVLTRDIDIDSPVLKASGMTRTELIKNFEQTGIYIKASAADFTHEVTVNILKDENTKTIGDISKLSDAEIQTITDNHLAQPMYNKGCSRTVYNNVMYLSFPFEYSEDKTKIAGVQKYTIFKGARIIITFQSYTGEISKEFDELIMSVMDRVLYDGVSPEPVTSSAVTEKKSAEITNLDIRYIYLMITGLVALIFLMLIIITAMKYKKSRKTVPAEPAIIEESPKEEIIPETIEESPKEEIVPEKTEESPKEEVVPEKTEEPIKEEVIPEKTEESPKEEVIPEKAEEPVKEEVVIHKAEKLPHNDSKDNEELPVVENQLELVEIALRIIPELTPENEDKTEIWNFIYKKYDDMEFFAAHGNQNYSNANAFYKINANSNIIPPPAKKENIDEVIRNETLEKVVGDSKPEELKTEKPPVEDKTDLNELVGGNGTDEKIETDSKNEIYNSDKSETKDTSK